MTYPSSLSKQELKALAGQGLEAYLDYISKQLLAYGWRLSTAESCTGGLVAAACTDLPGSSQWFDRGFVSYADSAKTELLGVPATSIDSQGAVSEPVVRAMAEGALAHSHAQVSLAITGIAGPTGGSAEKPIGTVWFGWCLGGKTYSEVMHFAGNRATVRQAALRHAMTRLAALFQKLPPVVNGIAQSPIPTAVHPPPAPDSAATLEQLAAHNQALHTQLKEITQTLHEKEALFRQLTEDTRDVLWQADSTLHITYISPADERLRGFPASEVVGQHVFEMLTDEGIAVVQQKLRNRAQAPNVEAESDFSLFEVEHRCKDGRLIWGEILAKADRDADGNITGYHGITRETTERKLLQDKVHDLAFYDPLTQLANRRLLLDHLSQELRAYQRQPGHGALLFLDLDNFKALNDAHGHGAGDLLLIEVARRLKTCVRNIDTVARFGGDEFVVLLGTLSTDHSKAQTQAAAIGEKIRASLAQPYYVAITTANQPDTTVEHHGTASIGVVVFSQQDSAPHDIIDRADTAMYCAKESGRNRVCFDSGMCFAAQTVP